MFLPINVYNIVAVADCADVLSRGHGTSGVYNISLDCARTLNVYCDMTTDGGGWLVYR